jgi:hypothetical protein
MDAETIKPAARATAKRPTPPRLAMSTTFDIPFIQYLMPDGREKDEAIPMPKAEYDKYLEAKSLGFNMGVELLSDWQTVSMTIEHRELGVDFDIVLCPNGPEVPKKLSEMLLRFDQKKAEKWIKRESRPARAPKGGAA